MAAIKARQSVTGIAIKHARFGRKWLIATVKAKVAKIVPIFLTTNIAPPCGAAKNCLRRKVRKSQLLINRAFTISLVRFFSFSSVFSDLCSVIPYLILLLINKSISDELLFKEPSYFSFTIHHNA